MAYSVEITRRSQDYGGVRNHFVTVIEKDVTGPVDVRIPNVPRSARVACIEARAVGSTVSPSLGRVASWGASGIDHVGQMATTALEVKEEPSWKLFSAGASPPPLYLRSNPTGTASVVITTILLTEGIACSPFDGAGNGLPDPTSACQILYAPTLAGGFVPSTPLVNSTDARLLFSDQACMLVAG